MDWFRYYNEGHRDKKLRLLARETGRSFIEMLGMWTGLLCLASDSPIRGVLMITANTAMSIDDIADELSMESDLVRKLIDPMLRPELEMLYKNNDGAIQLLNWDARQFETDTSAERTRKYRELKQQKPASPLPKSEKKSHNMTDITNCDVTVTPCDCHGDVTVTPPDTDTDTDTEGDISVATCDENLEIVSVPDAVPAAAGEGKPKRSVLKLCTLFGELNLPRAPSRTDHQLEIDMRHRMDWDEAVAIKAMIDCHEKARARAPDFRAKSLKYYADAISNKLEGKEVGNVSSGNSKKRKRSSWGM